MYDDLYCKVFIDAEVNYEEIFLSVMEYLGGEKKSYSYVVADWCDVFIQRNKEYKEEQYLQNTDNFLFWKYYLDIEPIETDEDVYIKRIHDLLRYLRESYKGAVAACDFEEELMD